jgi:hypothetical protein
MQNRPWRALIGFAVLVGLLTLGMRLAEGGAILPDIGAMLSPGLPGASILMDNPAGGRFHLASISASITA